MWDICEVANSKSGLTLPRVTKFFWDILFFCIIILLLCYCVCIIILLLCTKFHENPCSGSGDIYMFYMFFGDKQTDTRTNEYHIWVGETLLLFLLPYSLRNISLRSFASFVANFLLYNYSSIISSRVVLSLIKSSTQCVFARKFFEKCKKTLCLFLFVFQKFYHLFRTNNVF